MNTNVGDMPIEVFADYVSDCLGIEYDISYMLMTYNYHLYIELEDARGDGWGNDKGCIIDFDNLPILDIRGCGDYYLGNVGLGLPYNEYGYEHYSANWNIRR